MFCLLRSRDELFLSLLELGIPFSVVLHFCDVLAKMLRHLCLCSLWQCLQHLDYCSNCTRYHRKPLFKNVDVLIL